jgi:hypothetical protein
LKSKLSLGPLVRQSMIPKKPAPAKAGVDTDFRKEIMLTEELGGK